MSRPKYVASCSGGKDSVATLLLAAQHNEPLDEAVFSEVMFDQDTSGEVPEHRDFIYDRLKPFCEKELGIKFTILHADKTYDDVFHHVITRGPHKGEVRGFAWAGMCAVNRDCKIPPVRKYNAALSPDTVSYRYCSLLRKAYKGKVGKRCYYLLRDDFLKYNRYRRQCDLLWERQITTLDELLAYKENLRTEYDSLTAQRRALYRRKSKTTPADYSEQIQALTARIRELRREIVTCADIEMDCGMVQDKVQRAAPLRHDKRQENIYHDRLRT